MCGGKLIKSIPSLRLQPIRFLWRLTHFDEKAVITLPLPENKKPSLNALRARLEATSGIKDLSFSVGAPVSDNGMSTSFFLTEKGLEESYGIAFTVKAKGLGRDIPEGWLVDHSEPINSSRALRILSALCDTAPKRYRKGRKGDRKER